MQEAALRDAVVAAVLAEQLVTAPAAVHTLDLATMAARDADFTADFRLEAPPVPLWCLHRCEISWRMLLLQ